LNKRFLLILSLFWCRRVYSRHHCENCIRSLPKAIFLIFSAFGMISSRMAIIKAEGTVRVNPFLTIEEEGLFKALDGATSIDYLNLSAIFYSPGASKAIINGYVLEVNDSVDGKKVTDIESDRVILKDSEGKYVVMLRKIGHK